MISSLANFLMLILYHGGYPERVSWTLLMFTMGAVGIARVTIENSRAYSMGYALALGAAAFVVMIRFTGSPIFAVFVLTLIAYLSDRIVHDCTLIDDTVDASGQGLVDSGRHFVRTQVRNLDPEIQDAAESSPLRRGRKTHQPGRTVMYLALGALPLFGLGQFFLREDAQTWHRAQWLLAMYLFASLSLLVTTSFLGLRRYLRQRKVDMPSDVSIAWLAGGLTLVAAILAVAYLAPIPGQALASFELPDFMQAAEDLSSSRFGWGDEAAEKSNPDAATTRNDQNQEDKEIHSTTPQEGAPPGDAGKGKREKGPQGSEPGGKQASGSGDSPSKSSSDSGQPQPSDRGKPQPSDRGKPQPSDSGKPQPSDSGKPQPSDSGKQPNPSESPSPPAESRNRRDENGKPSETESSRSPRENKSDTQTGSKDNSSPRDNANAESRSDTAEQKQPSDDPQNEPSSERDDQPANEPKPSEQEASQGDQQQGEPSSDDQQQPKDEQQPSAAEQSDVEPAPADRQAEADPESTAEQESSSSEMLQSIADSIPAVGAFFRTIIFFVLAGIVVAFLWIHREAIANWWHQLWGRKQVEAKANSFDEFLQAETRAPPRMFSSFRNPIGKERDPRRVVVITFQAFEAWARERGSVRGKNETPSEFIARTEKSLPQVSSSATQVVDAYNRIVYGRGNATQRDLTAAERVWAEMRG